MTRPLIMGIVNVTPDSFSDGGQYLDTVAAIEHGMAMVTAGANLIDVGGESTRPGAARVAESVELDRVLPVVAALAGQGVEVSVDTMRAGVARAAIAAGAGIVNDVSGGLADADMAGVLADSDARWVLMHWRGHSEQMLRYAQYDDVLTEVRAELSARVAAAAAAGVDRSRLVIDPGLGFAKTGSHDWELLRRLPELADLGLPMLVGASRKSFLGALLAGPDGVSRPVKARDAATSAISLLAAQAGAWAVRVHDVLSTSDVLKVWEAVLPRSGSPAQEAPIHLNHGDAAIGAIELRGLRARAHHGVFPEERECGQEFVVDARLDCDIALAARSDLISDTVSYAEVADRLTAVLTGPPVALLETLVQQLLAACLSFPAVRTAEVTVHKPSAPIPHQFDDVTVTLRGGRT
jgi:dihydropteroate synthase